MPKYFNFRDDRNQTRFDDLLKKERCHHHLPTSGHPRCKRNVIIGSPFCFQHRKNIRVGPSTLPNAGTGLFADNGTQNNAVVFDKNDQITDYHGENVSRAVISNRYGNRATAPYGIELNRDQAMDGALKRGLGTLINHQPKHKANTRFSVARNRQNVHLVATKKIRNHKEMFVNYGKTYKLREPGVSYSTNSSKYNI